MNKTLLLARILRRCGNATADSKENVRVNEIFFIGLGIIAAVLLFLLGRALPSFNVVISDPLMFVQMFFMIGALLSLFFVFPTVINQLYMSNDLPILLTMPYSSSQIVMARLINLIKLPAGFCLVGSLPIAIGYATTSFSPGLILAAILSAICGPVIVLSFVGILVIVIMSSVKGIRNKDLLRTIGIILVFILFAGITILNNDQSGSNIADIGEILKVISRFNNVLPINFALGTLMSGFSIIALLEILGITAAFALVFLLLISKCYISSALAMQETAAGNGVVGAAGMEKINRRKSSVSSLTRKELRTVAREPAYLMNGFLYTIIFPIVMVFIYGSSKIGLSFMDLNSADGTLVFMIQMVPILTFLAASSNAIATSSFSRDGKSFGFLKTMPLNTKDILKAKRNAALIVCGCGSTLYVVVGGIILTIACHMPIWGILYGLLLNIPLLIFVVDTNVMHDIKTIDLNWESESEMLKSRTGVVSVIMMIAGLIIPLVLSFSLWLFKDFFPICIPIAVIVVPIVCLLLGFIQEKRLESKGLALLQKM